MLSEEEVANIKEQLAKQIEKFPEEQRESALAQIEAMNAEQLEEFLEKNNLIKNSEKCLFCSIIEGEIPSYKIAENKEAIAVLDINPVSKGHCLIIPREHKSIEEIRSAMQFAQEVSKIIKTKLNPENVKIETTSVQGHDLINIIPIYRGKKPERKKATEEELQELQQQLIVEEKPETIETPKAENISDLPKAPRRIP